MLTPYEWFTHPTENTAYPMTFGYLLQRYLLHPEPDFLAYDSSVCDEDTAGILYRRPVGKLSVTHIGKETDELANQLAHSGLD